MMNAKQLSDKIENLVKRIDMYPEYIEDGKQYRAAMESNNRIDSELQILKPAMHAVDRFAVDYPMFKSVLVDPSKREIHFTYGEEKLTATWTMYQTGYKPAIPLIELSDDADRIVSRLDVEAAMVGDESFATKQELLDRIDSLVRLDATAGTTAARMAIEQKLKTAHDRLAQLAVVAGCYPHMQNYRISKHGALVRFDDAVGQELEVNRMEAPDCIPVHVGTKPLSQELINEVLGKPASVASAKQESKKEEMVSMTNNQVNNAETKKVQYMGRNNTMQSIHVPLVPRAAVGNSGINTACNACGAEIKKGDHFWHSYATGSICDSCGREGMRLYYLKLQAAAAKKATPVIKEVVAVVYGSADAYGYILYNKSSKQEISRKSGKAKIANPVAGLLSGLMRAITDAKHLGADKIIVQHTNLLMAQVLAGEKNAKSEVTMKTLDYISKQGITVVHNVVSAEDSLVKQAAELSRAALRAQA